MKKSLIVLVLMGLLATACKKQEIMLVTNTCPTVWMQIVDGQNRIFSNRLNPGESVSVQYDRPAEGDYNVRTLTAKGYRLDNNMFVGTASTQFALTGGTNITGPREQGWNISSLNPGGCPSK